MSKNDKILAAIAGLCILGAIAGWSWNTSDETFAQYIGTLAATFAGVGIAAYISVRQFYAQAEQAEEARRIQIVRSLAAELSTMLDILASPPHFVVNDPTGGTNNVPVVFAQLEPTVTEEAIRLGLLNPQSTSNLYQLASLMREYSRSSDVLQALLYGPNWNLEVWGRSYHLARELIRERTNLRIWGVTVLYGLALQGVPMPTDPRYRSDPSIRLGGP